MSVSTTKENILARWRTNPLLNAAVLPVAPQSAHDLSVDHPTQALAPSMVTTTVEALQSGETHYVDVPGIRPLREKLATFLHNVGLAEYGVDHVLVTAGLQEARFLTIQKIGEQFGRIGMPAVVHPGAKLAGRGARHRRHRNRHGQRHDAPVTGCRRSRVCKPASSCSISSHPRA